MVINNLTWDSNFFGVKISRVDILASDDNSSISQAQLFCDDTALYYIFVPSCRSDLSDVLRQQGGKLVDVKRTYEIKLDKFYCDTVGTLLSVNPSIAETDQLSALAMQSAEFSRFKIDDKFPAGAWERLYSEWINKSVSGVLADYVFVHYIDNRIVGMLTLSVNEKTSEIGLFAVESEYRSQGIGRKLLKSAYNQSLRRNCKSLIVSTQKQNSLACMAYESFGFELRDDVEIFHFWRN